MTGKIRAWFLQHRTAVAGGLVLWGLLALGAWIRASRTQSPVLPAIVTWNEWAVALMLLPGLVTAGARGFDAASRAGRARATMEGVIAGAGLKSVDRLVGEEAQRLGKGGRPGIIRSLSIMAWVVFAIDLLVRAVYGLGWEPFL